jgi:hypothetical protein
MIIETFHPGKVKLLYQRFEEKGRQLPAGVHYINSWIDKKLETCYQVMESDSELKLQEWVQLWADLSDFQINPVFTSEEVKEKVLEG